VITRRNVALGGVLATVWNGCCAAAGASEPGCVIAGETADRLFARTPAEILNPDYFNHISMGSGDKALDFALAQTLSRITEAFHVLPGFVFYDDRDSANSFATPRLRFPKTDGTILLGTRFLKQILARPEDPEIALTAICAHEFAHVLQFKCGLLDALFAGEPTVRRCELHADFFASFCRQAEKANAELSRRGVRRRVVHAEGPRQLPPRSRNLRATRCRHRARFRGLV